MASAEAQSGHSTIQKHKSLPVYKGEQIIKNLIENTFTKSTISSNLKKQQKYSSQLPS